MFRRSYRALSLYGRCLEVFLRFWSSDGRLDSARSQTVSLFVDAILPC
jgi:hypothetical protein